VFTTVLQFAVIIRVGWKRTRTICVPREGA